MIFWRPKSELKVQVLIGFSRVVMEQILVSGMGLTSTRGREELTIVSGQTTPLPVVYSVHLRQTVIIYLFALPAQLVAIASWWTIPVLTIASFLFLGL